MIIIRDTREKIGRWEFCDARVIDTKLESGDYSIKGLEDYVCIERKKSTAEMATNLGSDIKRFTRELERMSKIPVSYIICEFTITDLLQFPKGSHLSPKQMAEVKINGKYMVKLLDSFLSKYGVQVIYAGNRENAIEHAEEIFRSVIELKG